MHVCCSRRVQTSKLLLLLCDVPCATASGLEEYILEAVQTGVKSQTVTWASSVCILLQSPAGIRTLWMTIWRFVAVDIVTAVAVQITSTVEASAETVSYSQTATDFVEGSDIPMHCDTGTSSRELVTNCVCAI